ncbi:uncharacterized protein [Hoplias malabaricus]|uniref:uncharacterized protein n=1 Tax=Hoplias malabaricus TaxID=27720 RepID=UPI0034623786
MPTVPAKNFNRTAVVSNSESSICDWTFEHSLLFLSFIRCASRAHFRAEMASLKRQRSWHEDFARNFFRLFSRSKSLDQQEKTETELDNGEEHVEEDGATAQSVEDVSLHTPEDHFTVEPVAQTLEHLEQEILVDVDALCDSEGSVQDDAESDPPPVTLPAPEPHSPATPVDGFFRRLGSLFTFTRAESGGADRQSQSSAESEAPGAEDTQHTDPKTVPPGETESQTSVERGEQHLKPQELFPPLEPSQSVAGPEVKAPFLPERDIQDTQVQEDPQAEDDEEGPVEPLASDEEQDRRRALASPPVVTHVTYRGLRKIKKMRRKQEMRLQSPISEGEEGQHGASLGLSEDEDGANVGSPCITPGESKAVQLCAETSLSSDIIRSDCESHVSPCSCSVPSSIHIPAEAERTDCASRQSASQAHIMAGSKPAEVEPDLTLTSGISSPGENDHRGLAVLLEADTSNVHTDELEPALLGTGLKQETQTKSMLNSDIMKNLVSAQALETPHLQLSDTATHLTDINTASKSHTCIVGLDVATDCCQESQLSGSPLDGQGPEDNQVSKAEISGHAFWKATLVLEDGATQLGLAEEPQRLNEEMLELESKKMVDDILKSALAALARIDASAGDSKTPLSGEFNESDEPLLLLGARDSVDGSATLEQMFQEHSAVQADGNPQLNLSDESLGGRVQMDGSRSTPSSGYESIAGSDTDIRSMAMSAEIASSSGPISTHYTEPVLKDKAVIGYCTEDIELCVEVDPVCQNSRQNSRHSTFLLAVNLEETEGPARNEANGELLSQHDLNDSNITHKTNITSAQPVISESLSVINKEAVQCALEERGVHICVTQLENEDPGSHNATKVSTESNNNGHDLGLDSGDMSLIINNLDVNHIQTNKHFSLSGFGNLNSETHSHSFEIRDFSEKEDRPNLSVRQSHAVHPVNCEPELSSQDQQSGHTQGGSYSANEREPSFALVKTFLATVIADEPDCEMEKGEMASADPTLTRSANLDSSYDFTAGCSAVKFIVSSVTDDPSQKHEADSLMGSCLHSSGRLAALPVSVKAHLDIPGSSFRSHATDLQQGPRGFTIISEEEELDTVFVNDTGPILSPSTRRAKAYPFALSPIYEEDSGREDASREDPLHVPPATEEEQRSVEQQASSVLSLLQSVSERLQSSAFSGSEDGEEKCEEPEHPQQFLRPLWDRYNNDDDAADEESSLLLQQQLTGISLHSAESECAMEGCASPSFSPDQKIRRETQGGELGKKHDRNNLINTKDVIRSANTPFYQLLKSSIVPSRDRVKNVLHLEEGSVSSTTLTRMGSFGKLCPRSTLLHIYEDAVLSRNRRDVWEDVEDARHFLFAKEATILARRGCWLLYVEPGYKGSCMVLEEGETVQVNGATAKSDGPPTSNPNSVGSIRRALKDDNVPEIQLPSICTEEKDPVYLHSEANHVDMHGPIQLSDLNVHSGCWLAYDGAGFTGNRTVLEAGGLTTPVLQNSPISCVRSLRPVRMGGLRVRRPLDPKIVLYEKPQFQGQSQELLENMPRLEAEGELVQVSSLQVTGGVWVGYSCENYKGQQRILEEGGYSDCSALFGEPGLTLRSCRFLQADFTEPEVSLKSSGEQMKLIDKDVPDLQLNGLTEEAGVVHVKSGVWVAYSGKYYTEEQCVLEKGQHPGRLYWGERQSSPLSIRPIRRELCSEEEPKFLLRSYSKPCFAGESSTFESETADCGVLSPASFRVIQGSWLLYDEKGYCGNQFVLGEGLYPDLASCGCVEAAIKSFKPIPYSFSEPFISLFSLSSFEGLETVADSPMETMDSFFTQSLRVNSGLWVVYEFSQFKGRQMLLQTGEYPCWCEYSGWDTVGSLQPLRQRRMYVQLRSRALGTALTVERTLDPSSPPKLLLQPADRSQDTQYWIYNQDLLKSKVGKGCLSVIGGKACVGARVALWEEHGRIHQRWSLNENGTISPHLDRSLVLDRRGGSGIDRDHLILNEFCADNATQFWDIEVL